MNSSEIISALEDKRFEKNVIKDIEEAQQIGVKGVPFFVFDRKYAVSGAQPMETFLNALSQSLSESKGQSSTCTPGGGCC